MIEHEIWLDDPQGNRIILLDTFLSAKWAKVANNLGAWSVTLPHDFDDSLFRVDGIVEFWRKPTGGALQLNHVGRLRYMAYKGRAGDKDDLVIAGDDMNDLLKTRIVAYNEGTTQAEKTDYLDDMMKEIVKENLGASATDSDRDLSGLNFTVAADLSAAPSDSMKIAHRFVLDVLRDIADLSREQGTNLYFEVVPIAFNEFEFRTYTGQIGQDRTESSSGYNPVIFGREWENLENPYLEFDYRDEKNVIYALGQGQEDDREIVEVEDTERSSRSVWGRREGVINAGKAEDTTGYTAIGNLELEKGRPKLRFRGDLLDTEQTRYGKDWYFGDRVSVDYRGNQYDGMVNAITIRVDDMGQEFLTTYLELDDIL